MANAQIHVDYMKNGRGVHYFLHAGYKYSKTRRVERVYWKCVLRQCAATLITFNEILMSLGQYHNHLAKVVSLAADALVNQTKKRCREQVTPIPSIYDEEICSIRDRDNDDHVGGMIKKNTNM